MRAIVKLILVKQILKRKGIVFVVLAKQILFNIYQPCLTNAAFKKKEKIMILVDNVVLA